VFLRTKAATAFSAS